MSRRFRNTFIMLGVLIASTSLAEESKPTNWNLEIRSDQQESIGYQAHVGYRLPVWENSVMPLFNLPGLFLDLGVGERNFADSTATSIDSVKASSWSVGALLKAPVSESMYLSQRTSVVHLKLPKKASAKKLDYLEVGFGIGAGAAEGAFVEIGANLRVIDKLDKLVAVGSNTIHQTAMLYPSMAIGYRM